MIAVAGLFFLCVTHIALAAGPSFDCTKASNPVERAICASDSLSRQDVKLSRLYRNVRDGLPAEEAARVKAEQLEWLKNRNRKCSPQGQADDACLAESYRERNKDLAAMLAFDASAVPAGQELKLLRITPKGDDVPPGRQIVFQFDRPVVPIGRMERSAAEIPVTVTPALACEWRWLNTSALACQLREEDQMKPATRYEVVMAPGITTEHGARLKKRRCRLSYCGYPPRVGIDATPRRYWRPRSAKTRPSSPTPAGTRPAKKPRMRRPICGRTLCELACRFRHSKDGFRIPDRFGTQ